MQCVHVHVSGSVPVAVICGPVKDAGQHRKMTLPRSRRLKTHGCYLVMNAVWSTANGLDWWL